MGEKNVLIDLWNEFNKKKNKSNCPTMISFVVLIFITVSVRMKIIWFWTSRTLKSALFCQCIPCQHFGIPAQQKKKHALINFVWPTRPTWCMSYKTTSLKEYRFIVFFKTKRNCFIHAYQNRHYYRKHMHHKNLKPSEWSQKNRALHSQTKAEMLNFDKPLIK